MTLSGIAMDKWACGQSLIDITIVFVSICFWISFTLFLIRTYQVYQQNKNELVTFPEKLLQACHLLAMFFSSFYMFLYVWNYLHTYSKFNEMNCSLWFILVMISITSTKVFIYSFLMLRSTLSFRNSFFAIPLSISIPITLIMSISQLTWMALMLSDFSSINRFLPNGSMCFRKLGPIGTLGIVGFNINDAISAFVTLLIFWIKAKSVKNMLFKIQSGPKESKIVADEELNQVFGKHIKLGILITLGSLLIFLAGEFLTYLMGVASVLHQCLNNIYIFLLFRDNNKLYTIFCTCGCKETDVSGSNHFRAVTIDNVRSEGVMYHGPTISDRRNDTIIETMNDTTVVDTLREMADTSPGHPVEAILSKSFLSKSLSSIPRCSSMGGATKKDIKSMSSHNLKAPMPIRCSTSNLALMNYPTLSETPSAVNNKKKFYGHFDNETLSTPMFPLTPIAMSSHSMSNVNNNNDKMQHLQPNDTSGLNNNSQTMELPEMKMKSLSVVYDKT